jgi:hypothetical protein
LTSDNLDKPWIIFEAGAMSRSLDRRIAPLLVGVDKSDVKDPLAQFQLTSFDKDDVGKLVHSINRVTDAPVAVEALNRRFNLCWPGLVEEIGNVPSRTSGVPAQAAPKVAVAASGPSLSDKQIEIVKILANNPESEPTAGMMGRAINENETRAHYHLDGLKGLDLVHDNMVVGEPSTYYLTSRGRAYAVEHGLV